MSNSEQLANSKFKGLMVEDGQLYSTFITDTNEIIGVPLTKALARKMFPKIMMVSGKLYLSSQDGSVAIEIDPHDEMGELVLEEHDLRRAKAIMTYQLNPVPAELQHKYCLLFGGHVLFSSDTKEEIEKYERNNPTMGFTTYIPPSTKKEIA